MLKAILQRVASGAIGTAAMALAAAVTMVSAAYGFYAVLRTGIGPAGAAGLTALAAAVVCAVLAVVVMQIAKGRSKPPAPQVRHQTVKSAVATGGALLAAAADVALQYRAEHGRDRKTSKRKRR